MKQDDSSTVKQPENGKRWSEQSMQEQRLSSYEHAAVADRIRAALCGMQSDSENNKTSGVVK
ncbi:MAG: hypothetical protein ACRYE8_06045 [Janthinobacterium lividum]